jgi:hypothetical protein
MKSTAALLLFLLSIQAFAQNPFSKIKFDKVVAYDFLGGKESDVYIITSAGKLSESVVKQAELDKNTIAQLNEKLGSKSSYGKGTFSCFEPHLGIVYYFKGKVTAFITVCLQCNRLRASVDIPAQNQGKVGSGNDVYYVADGMSDTFKKFLNRIVVTNKFSHALKK